MTRMLAAFVLSVAMLAPTFGQETRIKLQMKSIYEFDGGADYLCEPPDSSYDKISGRVSLTGAAAGDYTCWVLPSEISGPTPIEVIVRLKNYRYDDYAGVRDLHAANVTILALKSTDPHSPPVEIGIIPVLMDIPYYAHAETTNILECGTIALGSIPPEMPPQMIADVTAPSGYVFTEWTGLGAELGCVVPDASSPTISFDFVRYFITLGMTKQCYLQANFLPQNTEVGEDVLVTLADEAGQPVVTLTFDNVETAGHTDVSISQTGPPPPGGFRLGIPPTYFDITTTSEYEGSILVCIDYSGISLPSRWLRLLHYEDGRWVVCDATIDPENQTICAQVESLSPFTIAEPVAIDVVIDIKPGSYPNSINPNSQGVIPVALFGSEDLEATEIDPLSLDLAGLAVQIRKKGTPQCSLTDVNADGYTDLLCHFANDSTAWTEGTTTATLTGRLRDETPIEGTDEVRIVKRSQPGSSGKRRTR